VTAYVALGCFLAVLALLAGQALFRRYQDYRIRQHRRRVAWREYKQSKGIRR